MDTETGILAMALVANARSDLRAIIANRRCRISFRFCLISLLGILFLTACTQNRSVPVDPLHAPNPPAGTESENRNAALTPQRSLDPRTPQERRDVAGDTATEDMLRREYSRWLGTRHRLGGNDRNGIDCSAFVRAVYRKVFRLDLPRTTSEQVRQGKPVLYQDMRVGDLVFFKPPDYSRHVGIYLGDSQFVHASKTSGVTVSPIDRYYWQPHFWTARRILAD